jgi:hypothetical protein
VASGAVASRPLRNLSEVAARVTIFHPEKVDPNSFTEEFREFLKRERRKPEIRRLLAEVAPSKPAPIQASARARAPRSRRTRTTARRGPPSGDDPSKPDPPLGGLCQCGCGRRLPVAATGRPRRYYEDACRVRAWRSKHRPQAPAEWQTPADTTPVTKLSGPGRKLTASEWDELRRRVARAQAAREEAESEAINARIRAQFEAEGAAA